LQHDDGTVDRLVTVHCDDDVLTPAAVRKLAAAITAAAADESTGSHNGGASFAPAACRARRWSTARSSEQRRPAVAIMRAIGQAIWDLLKSILGDAALSIRVESAGQVIRIASRITCAKPAGASNAAA
jgi:hypothetical protein